MLDFYNVQSNQEFQSSLLEKIFSSRESFLGPSMPNTREQSSGENDSFFDKIDMVIQDQSKLKSEQWSFDFAKGEPSALNPHEKENILGSNPPKEWALCRGTPARVVPFT